MFTDPHFRRPPRAVARFAADEHGSFVLFGIYLFIGMLLVGGLAVDIMRHDYARLQMQGTVDNSILAAADLDQKLDPEAVVKDYFEKAGILHLLTSVNVSEDVNSRTVRATAERDVETMFIQSLGIDYIGADAGGTAHEEIREIEVSMVLDFSGSMDDHNRIENLKDAATSFVDTLMPADGGRAGSGATDEISISIVPYSTQAAVPDIVLDNMTLEQDLVHDYSNCIDFTEQDFETTALPFGIEREQTAHFDPFSGRGYDVTPGENRNLVCRNDNGAEATIMSKSRAELLGHINALVPNGNTSAELGLKWAIGFLDPSFRPVARQMADAGMVDDTFRDRPFAYDRDNAMKVVVLMTDGNNTTQYRLKDSYNGDEWSDIWVAENDGEPIYSVHDPERYDRDNDGDWSEDYFIEAIEEWWDTPYGEDDARRLRWREVWARMSVKRHAEELRRDQYDDWDDYNYWAYRIDNTESPNEKDRRMADICDAIKARDVLVFSVGLEVTDDNAAKLRSCATSDNHFFKVDGREIVYAFTAIASTINQLRLVQ